LDTAPDSLNGFTASMILLHLLQQRLISRYQTLNPKTLYRFDDSFALAAAEAHKQVSNPKP